MSAFEELKRVGYDIRFVLKAELEPIISSTPDSVIGHIDRTNKDVFIVKHGRQPYMRTALYLMEYFTMYTYMDGTIHMSDITPSALEHLSYRWQD